MWKNIDINIQNIEIETRKSTLIKMPNKSNYAGYKFWHPSKLIREGRNSYSVSLGYTNDFTFKLKKYGNGKYNKFDVIDEIELSLEEFEKAFQVMDENIQLPNYETYLIIEEPNKIDIKVKVADELENE